VGGDGTPADLEVVAMETRKAEDLVRRLAAALRGAELYSPTHPLVSRSLEALHRDALAALREAASLTVGFIGDDIVVDGVRLARGSAALISLARDLRTREVDKVTITRGLTIEDIRGLVAVLSDRESRDPVTDRMAARHVRHIQLGRIIVEEVTDDQIGIAAARRVYATAVETAQSLWDAAKAGDHPDPGAARKIIDGLARLATQDRTSIMALTTLKKYDNYTFTHMVNVSALAMVQARALGIDGDLLREFGFAALMHDIGKVHTPLEVLNKPDKLTKEEFEIMKRHVVDGAHILRRTPEMPALAPIVAFEHHLKQDLSGYPEKIGSRSLNLCTMVVSIADVFDALRSNRPYRQGLATARIRAIMGEQGNPAFNQVLLKRFVNVMGLFPVGHLVRLTTEELAVVTAEHPTDPLRPQVKVITDRTGQMLEEPVLVNTWERENRGDDGRAVVEAVDPESVGIDPLKFM
jgi:putative nucleotidyltransferase with HDIG domain